MEATRKKNLHFTKKEVLDFKRMCTIHGFKKRNIEADSAGNVYKLHIYLPFTNGSIDRLLGNVARYTNSRRCSYPCNDGRNLYLNVEFKKA